jgi:excisionase family DNA binding protein
MSAHTTDPLPSGVPLVPAEVSLRPGRPGRLLEAGDVADLLGVPRTFVYALARRGAIPTVRLGDRYVRFRAEAIADWIAGQETTQPRGSR